MPSPKAEPQGQGVYRSTPPEQGASFCPLLAPARHRATVSWLLPWHLVPPPPTALTPSLGNLIQQARLQAHPGSRGNRRPAADLCLFEGWTGSGVSPRPRSILSIASLMLGQSMSICSSRKEPSDGRGGSLSAASLRGSEFVPSVLGKLGEVGWT